MRVWLLLPLLVLSNPVSSQEEIFIVDNSELPEGLEISSLNLNQTDAPTLQLLTSLSSQQINDIIRYRNQYGAFLAPVELQVIRSLSLGEIKSLLKQFYILESYPIQPTTSSNGHILYRYKITSPLTQIKEPQGNSDYMMLRFQYRFSEKLKGAVSMEKDAGEKIYWEPAEGYYGADHLAGFIQWRPSRKIEFIAGNILVHHGQGLVSGAGFNLGKGRNPIESLISSTSGISGYRGLQESLAGLGAGLHFTLSKIRILVYKQQKKLDAVLHSDSDKIYFHSIQTSGHHRAASEINNRHSVKRKTSGLLIESSHLKFLTLGVHMKYDKLNHPMKGRSSPDKQYTWSGNDLLTTSLLMRIRYRQLIGWTEFAVNHSGKSALQTGLLVSLGRQWSSSILVRNYTPGYFAFDSNAFGERSSGPENERGVFIGLSYQPKKKWTISAYTDFYRFPWLTHSASAPGTGVEYFISSRRQFKNGLEITLDYRVKEKPANLTDPLADLQQVKTLTTRQAGLYLIKKVGLKFESRFRYRWKQISHGGKIFTGSGAYQEIILKLRKWNLSYRFTLFDTEDYSSRIYFYERDVWGSFSLPAFFGKGISQYFLIRFRVSRWCDLWIRAALSQGVKIGGNNKIYTRREEKKMVSCQVRINL